MKEHCADSRNECPVIRFIEDVLQVKLLPYQKLLATHVFETNECKGINLCSDCRTKMEKKMDDTVSRQEATDALRKMQTYKMFEGDDVLLIDQAAAMTELMLLPPAEQNWIPCSVRMPEEHEWLGTKRFGTTKSDEVYVTFESPKGERFCKHVSFQNGKVSGYDQRFIDAICKGSRPIAWRPLPEAWKGEMNDAKMR